MHMTRTLYAKLNCRSNQTREPVEVSELKLLQSDEIHWLELLTCGTMKKALLPWVLPLPAFGGSRSARWSTSASKCMFCLFTLTPHVERNCLEANPKQTSSGPSSGRFRNPCSTNSITVYFSQNSRSLDQFSAAKLIQPVHLQHHLCKMSFQHITPRCY